MIKAHVIFMLSIILSALSMNAQELPLTNEAARLCQEKQFDKALSKIKEAKETKLEGDNPYLWYVDGFIHKEMYKQNESGNRSSIQREMAVESFIKSLEMDKQNQHAAMTKLSLKFQDVSLKFW